MTYYDNGTVQYVDATEDHIQDLADNMRGSDKREVWASHNITAYYAASESFVQSDISIAVLHNDRVAAIFGVAGGMLWMLGTDRINDIQVAFLRKNHKFIKMFLIFFESLENWVDVRNQMSIQWLKWLGAEFDEPAPYGVEGKLFQHFVIRRNALCASPVLKIRRSKCRLA